MDKKELKKFVNKILEKKGHKPVMEFAKEFSDGSKFWVNNQLIAFLYSHVLECFQCIVWWENWLFPQN